MLPPRAGYLTASACGSGEPLACSAADDGSGRQRWRLGSPDGAKATTMCYPPPQSIQVNIQARLGCCRPPWGSRRACMAVQCRAVQGGLWRDSLVWVHRACLHAP